MSGVFCAHSTHGADMTPACPGTSPYPALSCKIFETNGLGLDHFCKILKINKIVSKYSKQRGSGDLELVGGTIRGLVDSVSPESIIRGVSSDLKVDGAELGRADDHHAGCASGCAVGADFDDYVVFESGGEVHEALDGEAFEFVAPQRGDLRLVDAEDLCGLGLGEFALVEDLVDDDAETELGA